MKRQESGSRRGASLVFALFTAAALVSLALAAGVAARGRAARAASRMDHIALGEAAREALERTLWEIESDTNSVDHLSEKWALDSVAAREKAAAGGDGVFVFVSDERARLGFPECGEAGLSSLLAVVSGLDAASAAGLSHAVFSAIAVNSGGAEAAAAPGGGTPPLLPYACEEAAMAGVASAEEAKALAAALPFLSASAGVAFNVNAAPRETVVSAALAAGATPGGAEGLWLRLEMARNRGDVFESASPSEAMKLLKGEGDTPTPEEISALAAVQPLLRVDSGLFRVEALARRRGREAAIECVYERGTGRIFRWLEF